MGGQGRLVQPVGDVRVQRVQRGDQPQRDLPERVQGDRPGRDAGVQFGLVVGPRAVGEVVGCEGQLEEFGGGLRL